MNDQQMIRNRNSIMSAQRTLVAITLTESMNHGRTAQNGEGSSYQQKETGTDGYLFQLVLCLRW